MGWWETEARSTTVQGGVVTWDGSAEEGWWETVTWVRRDVTWDGSAEEGWWETVTWVRRDVTWDDLA